MTDPRKPNPEPAVPDVDPDAPPSEEELALADALREALDQAPSSEPSSAADRDAALLRALALTESPRPLDEAAQDKLVGAALDRFDRKRGERRGVVIRVVFGGAALVAAAAAVLLLVGRPASNPTPLAHARSTQSLFDQPFDRGQASARADRIDAARASELRSNRFAMRLGDGR